MSEHRMQTIALRAVAALERIAEALEVIADSQDVGDYESDEVEDESLSSVRGRVIPASGRGGG